MVFEIADKRELSVFYRPNPLVSGFSPPYIRDFSFAVCSELFTAVRLGLFSRRIFIGV